MNIRKVGKIDSRKMQGQSAFSIQEKFVIKSGLYRLNEPNCDYLKIIAVFQVCDSILNVGPCGHVAMGQPSFLSEELQSTTKADPDVELVSTSGHGKNGALCVLQQTIRPQVVTTFELPGVIDMWTVIGKAVEGLGTI